MGQYSILNSDTKIYQQLTSYIQCQLQAEAWLINL